MALKGAGQEVELLTKGSPNVDTPLQKGGLPLRKMPLGGGLDFITPVLMSRLLRRDPARCLLVSVYSLRDAALAVRARSLVQDAGKQVRIVCMLREAPEPTRDSKYTAILPEIDSILFPTKHARDLFLSRYPKADPSKVHVVPLSVPAPEDGMEGGKETEDERRQAEEGTDNGQSKPLTLLCISEVASGRGLETLMKALGRLADIPLRLKVIGVGKGPYVSNLKGEVWRNHAAERVEWLSTVSDVFPEICKADIGVVPGGETPSFGLPLLEFMSQGVPVVAASKPVVEELITDGKEGLLADASDVEDWAEALRRLATDSDMRRNLGSAARQRYLRERQYADYIRHWRTLTGGLFS